MTIKLHESPRDFIHIQFTIKNHTYPKKQIKNQPQTPPNRRSRAHFSCSRLTLRLSSAASNFFWISSNDTSFFFGGDRGNSGTASFERGLRISSKACPEARFSSSFTWISGNAGGKARKKPRIYAGAGSGDIKNLPEFSTTEGGHPRQEFCSQHSNTAQKCANFLSILPQPGTTQAPHVLIQLSTSQVVTTSPLVQIKSRSPSSHKPEGEFPGVCVEHQRAQNYKIVF